MLVILLMCAPLEVADVIVLWIAVDVIDLWEVVWIGNPSLLQRDDARRDI